MTEPSKVRKNIINSLKDKMLKTSLWGVFNITYLARRYEIIDIVEELIKFKYFKKYGFTIKLLDSNCFVQKIPYFEGNDEFIKKNDLYFTDIKSYPKYLLHMYKEQERYNNEI